MDSDERFTVTAAQIEAIFQTNRNRFFGKDSWTRAGDVSPPAQPGQPPKLLIVAGVQGSGKTYLLENELIPSGRYANHVPLYRTHYRTLHPRYADLAGSNSLERYQHTEQFIWALGRRITRYALDNRLDIVMETALDSPHFASFPAYAAQLGYRFELHLIGCKKDFAHVSTIGRLLKCLASNELERNVSTLDIQQSLDNARDILDAFEQACMKAPGSTITLYERGFGTLKDRRKLCSSTCQEVDSLTPDSTTDTGPRIERNAELPSPCSYPQYMRLIDAPILDGDERTAAWNEAYRLRHRMRGLGPTLLPVALGESIAHDLDAYYTRYALPASIGVAPSA